MIPYSKQSISDDDIKSFKVLKSNFLTQGNVLENSKKKFLNMSVQNMQLQFLVHLWTTSSLSSLKFEKNDILWTVPNTFLHLLLVVYIVVKK